MGIGADFILSKKNSFIKKFPIPAPTKKRPISIKTGFIVYNNIQKALKKALIYFLFIGDGPGEIRTHDHSITQTVIPFSLGMKHLSFSGKRKGFYESSALTRLSYRPDFFVYYALVGNIIVFRLKSFFGGVFLSFSLIAIQYLLFFLV